MNCNCHSDNCKAKVPPVYIVLYRGDSSDFAGNQQVYCEVKLPEGMSKDGLKAHFRFLDFAQDFEEIPDDGKLVLVFPKEKTAQFPLGAMDATLALEDAQGRVRTIANRIHVVVTNSVSEAYDNEDEQAITVIVSGGTGVTPEQLDNAVKEVKASLSDVAFDMECNDWDFRKIVAKVITAFGGTVENEND